MIFNDFSLEIKDKLKLISYQHTFKIADKQLTDVNWGCVLRAGQMLLYNLLVLKMGLSESGVKKLFSNETSQAFSISNLLVMSKIPSGNQWSQKLFFITIQKVIKY